MGGVKNFLRAAGLGALLLLSPGQVGAQEPSRGSPEKYSHSYSSKRIDKDKVYVGARANEVVDYEGALRAIKRDRDSGMLFIGFSDAELRIGQEIVWEYVATNPKLIDRLEPVTIKVEEYNEDIHGPKSKLSEEELRNSTFAGRVHPNVKNLEECIGNLGKVNYQVRVKDYWAGSWRKLWVENAYDTEAWADGSIKISDLLRTLYVPPINIDSYDVIFWVGLPKTNNFRKLLFELQYQREVIAHELGHLIDFENPEDMAPLFEQFSKLTKEELDYVTPYSAEKAREVGFSDPELINLDFVRIWFKDKRMQIIDELSKRIDSNKKVLASIGRKTNANNRQSYIDRVSAMFSRGKSKSISLEEIAGLSKEQSMLAQPCLEEIKIYDLQIRELESLDTNSAFTEFVDACKKRKRETQDLIIKRRLKREDWAEACAWAVLGLEARTPNGNKKVALAKDFMINYK